MNATIIIEKKKKIKIGNLDPILVNFSNHDSENPLDTPEKIHTSVFPWNYMTLTAHHKLIGYEIMYYRYITMTTALMLL